MKVLFIGGNGNISWYCVQKCLEAGFEVWELNRGETRKTRRPVQCNVHQIICDIRNEEEVRNKLKDMYFDVVCDFICYNEIHAVSAINIFKNITKQYIYISSESVYERNLNFVPISENSKLYDTDKVDGYILGKLNAEQIFKNEFSNSGFPVTIIRPGYTYDTIMPVSLGYNCFTVAKKLIEGFPLVIIGNGNNMWSPLHSEDFANIFINFIGNTTVIGDCYNIVSETSLSINEMGKLMLSALGIKREIINIEVDDLMALNSNIIKDREIALQGTKDYIYDASKTKIVSSYLPKIRFEEGIYRTVNWFLSNADYQRVSLNLYNTLSQMYDEIL